MVSYTPNTAKLPIIDGKIKLPELFVRQFGEGKVVNWLSVAENIYLYVDCRKHDDIKGKEDKNPDHLELFPCFLSEIKDGILTIDELLINEAGISNKPIVSCFEGAIEIWSEYYHKEYSKRYFF